jgi:hypothetical protein
MIITNMKRLRESRWPKESGRPTRVRKTTKGKNKKHEDPRKPARVRKSSRVKEDCQVPRIQKPKSLEDWHHLRV